MARLLIAVSALYGFLLIYEMNSYMPWHHKFLKALEQTLLGHFGLWLATFQIRSRMRFLVAAIMIPSIAVVFLLWWNLHLSVAICALIGMVWLFVRLIWGTRLGN